MSRVGFYGKDQSEAQNSKTGPDWPILPSKDLFFWATPLPEVILPSLRGAWRDHCFRAPFSWFLHVPGPESLKSPLPAVFYWNVKGKTRKERKNTASFVASLGAGVQPRSNVQLFMPVSGLEKPLFSQFFLGFGVSFGEEKPFVISNASF